MSKTVDGPLTPEQKQANADYFEQIIAMVANFFIWKDKGEVFFIRDGKLLGTERGVAAIKEITPEAFHDKIGIQSKADVIMGVFI